MLKQEFLFPTQIYYKDISNNLLNIELEKNILKWSQEDKGLQRTNVNGWHSPTDMHGRKEYNEIFEFLLKMQNEIYIEENLKDDPIIGNMWANINKPGGYNRPHIHPNSVWSGVYYVKTPKNCGHLRFADPKYMSLMIQPEYTKDRKFYQRREVFYEAVAGRCFMFPSWLVHSVEENKSDELRISISFNFLRKRFL